MKNKVTVGLVFCYGISILLALVALFPLVWMIFASFKPKSEIFVLPFQMLPKVWTVSNYETVLGDGYVQYFRSLLITFLVSCSGVLLSLTNNTMAGYVFARMNFYGKKFLWPYCLVSMFVPGISIQITSYLVVNALGMVDTVWALIIPGATAGYSIFFFRQFFLNMPASMEDAARVDGCGRFRIYWQIFLPMSKAPLVVMGAGCFIGYWNAYLWPAIVITKPELMQCMQIIRMLSTSYGNDYGAILAGSAMAVVLPVTVFCIFQRYIVQGFVLSGIK